MPPQPDAPEGPPLVWTKLHAPVPRRLVPRDELVELLCAGPPRRLTLLRAPAGWGKSTLLAEWHGCERENRPFAWFALDSGDNDPVRFWTYAIAALRTLGPEVGSGSLAVLGAPVVSVVDEVMPLLIDELAALSEPAVLAVDDLHLVRDHRIHDQLAFLIEHLPPGLELAVASRTEPPLPLARLRARGELLEIDATRLRFTLEETSALLNDLHGLELAPDDVERLRERTEGWAAGLYLGALSLRGREDGHDFVEAFAGDDRHVVDYLSAEVLAGQPEEVRRFLLRTSVLERLSAPLCDAVVGGGVESAAMLELIERSNFFLVPLDVRREWYRYHHLFRELLAHELSRSEPELAPGLHRAAAGWLLASGFVSDGIRHTLLAGDAGAAGELIAAHWAPTLLGTAGDRIVDRWLSALPDEVLAADFRLCFARCFVALSLGRMDDVRMWLRVAEGAAPAGPFLDGIGSKEGALACVRAALLWETGDAGGGLEAGHEVLRAEPGPWRAIGVATIGLGHAARGEWAEGRERMSEYARIGLETGQHLNHVSGFSTSAACMAELGELDEAGTLADSALELGRRHGIDEHWCSAHAHLARALALEGAGRLEDAEAALDRSVELAGRGSGPVYTAWPMLHMARVQAARGDRAAAAETLEECERMLAGAADAGIFPGRLESLRSELRVAAPARGEPATGEPLSEREREVLRLLASELSQREIGRELYLSLNTVKTHSRRIFRKLGVSTRDEAVARGREIGLP